MTSDVVSISIFNSSGLFWIFWWCHRPPPCPTPSLPLVTIIFVIYIPQLISVPIFNLIRTFWNFRWRHRPRPSGQTDRQACVILQRWEIRVGKSLRMINYGWEHDCDVTHLKNCRRTPLCTLLFIVHFQSAVKNYLKMKRSISWKTFSSKMDIWRKIL